MPRQHELGGEGADPTGPWVMSEYGHNRLRVAGGRILGHLIDLVRGRA